MTTPELVERFAQLETEIAQEKGDFALFALFMREEVPDRATTTRRLSIIWWRKQNRSRVTAIWSVFRASW